VSTVVAPDNLSGGEGSDAKQQRASQQETSAAFSLLLSLASPADLIS